MKFVFPVLNKFRNLEAGRKYCLFGFVALKVTFRSSFTSVWVFLYMMMWIESCKNYVYCLQTLKFRVGKTDWRGCLQERKFKKEKFKRKGCQPKFILYVETPTRENYLLPRISLNLSSNLTNFNEHICLINTSAPLMLSYSILWLHVMLSLSQITYRSKVWIFAQFLEALYLFCM